ncbi:heavy metal translocating P-type ATPase [Parasphingopyxis lamellibrachiae]|uniref:Cu2+-exporting ATPase n=1 Tax=Parasphingopyxis lamellibrachiae TaxID=680125 RepID=A0A3D9FEN7_9SPHN|nr:heavy metal translocating P-type ATPase [Parasphingopyxis lamellibrachiae]RED16295.1 Cu2+-exporting ATPase [Parasphingopyxis lamellibrachiae]
MNAPLQAKKPVSAEESRFAVPDIHCAGCISKIEHGLMAHAGVHAARVNFTSKQVSIAHDKALSDLDLAEAIRGLGFKPSLIAEDRSDEAAAAAGRELLRCLAVAGFAAMNVMLLSVSIWSGADGATRTLFHWISALIALPAIAYAGRPFFRSAWQALRHGRTNMDVPIAIGVTITAAISLYETIVGGDHAYFESALMLIFFLLVGRALDAMMRRKVGDGVAALARQSAPGALVIDSDGSSAWHKAAELRPGMIMQLAAGERLAGDGIVVEGESAINASLLTGESAPQSVGPGEQVFAGTLNVAAPLTVKVTAAADDTALADIGRLMATAGQSKSRYVRIADRGARLYAPVVHSLALLTFVGWMMAGADWHQALLIGVAVLIITCPCALGLAVPVAHVVATGSLMKRGILVKHESAIERLAEADRAVFDKTGTLTLDRLVAENLEELNHDQKAIALALARASRHPLATAIREGLESEGVRAVSITGLAELPGTGVTGIYEKTKVALEAPEGSQSTPAVALTIGDDRTAIIRFRDTLRPDAEEAVADIAGLGLPGTILSGDKSSAIQPIAGALHLTAQSNARPDDKCEALERLRRQGHRVLMVGDGLNDGPALAAAHVSIAPGSASDVGQNAADLVFLGDSLAPIPFAIRAARRTMDIVRQNFGLALIYNVVAVPLAIGGFVTPLVAAVAMSLSSLIVIANSLRLRRVR